MAFRFDKNYFPRVHRNLKVKNLFLNYSTDDILGFEKKKLCLHEICAD